MNTRTTMKRLLLSMLSGVLIFGFIGCKDDHNHGHDDHNDNYAIKSVFAINGNGTVTLGWTEMESGSAVGFQIHRSTSRATFEASSSTLYDSVGQTVRRYTDSALVNGQQYYYRVVPILGVMNGSPVLGASNEVTAARPFDYTALATTGPISYDDHIQLIFTSGCAVNGCHVGGEVGHHDHLKRTLLKRTHDNSVQFSLKSWEDVFKGGDHGAVAIPFKASKSHLIFHVNTDTNIAPVSLPHMPESGFNLPQEQILTLMRWLNEGGKNDAGEVPLSTFPKGKVFVTNQSEDLVAKIDIATNLVARYIQAGHPNVTTTTVPEAPHNITVDTTRGFYYVNLVQAGKVLKYRFSDDSLLATVSGIISPTQVELSVTGDTGYVAQFAGGQNAIRLFNTNTMTLIGQISSTFFDKPHGVQISPDWKELWITGNLSDNMLVIKLDDGTQTLIQLNNQAPGTGNQLLPYQTVMTSDNQSVYITCQKSNEVCVVDRSTMQVRKKIPVGQFPLIPAITPDSRFVYVPNRNSNSVSVISTETDSVVATISDVGPQPHGAAITRDGKYLYVACENVTGSVPPHHPTAGSRIPGFVTVIDIATNTVIKSFEVGGFAAGVAIVE